MLNLKTNIVRAGIEGAGLVNSCKFHSTMFSVFDKIIIFLLIAFHLHFSEVDLDVPDNHSCFYHRNNYHIHHHCSVGGRGGGGRGGGEGKVVPKISKL